MKVSFNNNPAFSFKARNRNIRQADDIMRKARNTFPLISPTYIDEFYSVVNNKKNDNREKAEEISSNLYSKLVVIRRMAKNPDGYNVPFSDIEKETPYAVLLNGIDLLKIGNCEECAVASLAALAANGIYDAKRVNLYLETKYINKQTGETEYRALNNLDHSFVVTSMGKKSDKEKDLVVVDTWLGFADSVSGAKARFKQIYDDGTMRDLFCFNRSMFRLEKMKKGQTVNFDDYELKREFVFQPADFYSSKQLEDLGLYSRIMFESLLTKK